MSKVNFKTMSRKELTKYISEHRNDEEKVRAAIAESRSRPGWTKVPVDTPLEEQERILREAIERKNQK